MRTKTSSWITWAKKSCWIQNSLFRETCYFVDAILSIQLNRQLLKGLQRKVQEWLNKKWPKWGNICNMHAHFTMGWNNFWNSTLILCTFFQNRCPWHVISWYDYDESWILNVCFDFFTFFFQLLKTEVSVVNKKLVLISCRENKAKATILVSESISNYLILASVMN